jgi:hypothetical protein
MHRSLIIVAIVGLGFGASQTKAQSGSVPGSPGEQAMRQAAINAILAFRHDLHGDSVKIARCRIAAGPADSVERWILPRARALLIAPFKSETGPMACSVMVFLRPGGQVLWLENVVEVRRRGSLVFSGPAEGLSFEVSFQWLRGADYQRFEQYEVRPRDPSGTEWRVVRYEFVGEAWTEPWGGASRGP